MSVRRRLAVLATATGLVSASLVTGTAVTSADAATAASASAQVQTVEVLVRRDNTVAMPTEIRPGVTKFKVSSARLAGFQILQAAPGYTKAEAVRDLNVFRVPALRRFEANLTFLGGVLSSANKSATMSVDLAAGTYWALDTMPRRISAAKILTFTVAGESVDGKLSGHVIRATGEAAWGKATPRIPTKGVIWFQNRSDANHFIQIIKLARGKTVKDFRAWLERAKQGDDSNPPVNLRASADSGIVSGGESMTFRYRLPKGRYVLLCWWPDADSGGMPHAMMGMVRGLKVG